MKGKILRSVGREFSKPITLLVSRAELGLLRDLLDRVLWDKALEGRGPQENWLILKVCLFLEDQEQCIPNKELRQKCQAVYVDEREAPGQTQTQKGSLQRMETRLDSLRGIQ